MKKILIFLSNGFETLEFSPFIDVFGWNNILSKNKIFFEVCGFGTIINSTWNTKILVDIDLNTQNININEYDAIILPGGFGFSGYFNDIQNKKIYELLHLFKNNDKFIIGICTGALGLAINGILEKIPSTTYLLDNGRYFNQLEKYNAIPVKKDIVISNKIITSSAPATAIKVAFYLLEQLSNTENMKFIKKEMGFKK